MRKSPIQHKVHRHNRSGVAVHEYVRGHGKHKLKEPSLRHEAKSVNYSVKIKYLGDSEVVTVSATNYPEAIESAMSMRRSSAVPIEVEAFR